LFFQAEDGIRDFHVTGVQTCALPISPFPQRASSSDPGQAVSRALSARTSHAGAFRRRDMERAPEKGEAIGKARATYLRPPDGLKIGRATCRDRRQNAAIGRTVQKERA